MHVKSLALFLLLALAALLMQAGVTGCENGTNPPVAGKDGANEVKSLRVVSLSPALTQMIRDMGHGGVIVGVDDSHAMVFDDLGDTPKVGQYSNANVESLISLKPTHVILMAGKEGPPANLMKQAGAQGFKVVAFTTPTNVREIITILVGKFTDPTIGDDRLTSEQSLSSLLGDDRGVVFANEMQRQLSRVSELADGASEPGKRPRVLVAFALEPRVQASGPQTVFDDLLRNYAGAYNAAIPELKPLTPAELNNIKDPEQRKQALLASTEDPASRVGPAPTFDREKLLEAKPDVILLLLPGEPPLRSIADDPRLSDFRGLDIPAVKNNRIVVISDKTALLPSTSLPRIAAEMAKAIHPSIAARIDEMFAPPKPPEETGKDATKDSGEKPAPPSPLPSPTPAPTGDAK